jgi:hypothetical protein
MRWKVAPGKPRPLPTRNITSLCYDGNDVSEGGETVANDISEVTRRSIIDYLIESNLSWSGRFGEDDFLARIYDLTKLPSEDHRYRNAAGDIHQHRIRNNDWPDDWVFHDSRFNLLHTSDRNFLRFLCETLHPIVRPNTEEVHALLDAYNRQLATDGWVIVESKKISGRPVFTAQDGTARVVKVFEEPTGWQKVDRQLQEVRLRLDAADSEEQYQAVGLLCRETLISVAQEVYNPARHRPADGVLSSDTDAKRMLDAIFEADLTGSTSEEARAHAKAAVRLALALQHKRTADFKTAALCAEGTWSVVNMLAVLAGRRGRSLG